MKNVQMVIPMPDDVIEEAAIQAIKSKVREIVDERIDGTILDIIKERVEAKTKRLLSDTHWNGIDRGVNEYLKRLIEKDIAESYIGKQMDDKMEQFKKDHLHQLERIVDEQMELVGANASKIVEKKLTDVVRKTMADLVLDGIKTKE